MPRTKQRRRHVDSTEAAVEAFAAVATDIQPPTTVRLRDGDLPYWSAVVRARARDEWSDADLHHAANLARCLADIERISAEIAAEGDVVENARGTPIANPRHGLMEILSRRAVAITRLLQINARAVTRPEEAVAQRALERKARGAVDQADDLLATPMMQ